MMKAVQFTIDEELLRRIDKDVETQRVGRSESARRTRVLGAEA